MSCETIINISALFENIYDDNVEEVIGLESDYLIDQDDDLFRTTDEIDSLTVPRGMDLRSAYYPPYGYSGHHEYAAKLQLESDRLSTTSPRSTIFGPLLEGDPRLSEAYPGADGQPDLNMYQQKKTVAQGMMDIALLSANANQLRYVLEAGNRHPYFYAAISFIGISLILQIAVGVGLILNTKYDVLQIKDVRKANRVNNFTVLGIFIVTVVNVFVTAFGVAMVAAPV